MSLEITPHLLRSTDNVDAATRDTKLYHDYVLKFAKMHKSDIAIQEDGGKKTFTYEQLVEVRGSCMSSMHAHLSMYVYYFIYTYIKTYRHIYIYI